MHPHHLSRRRFLTRTSAGLGAAALTLLSADGKDLPHFAPRAKRVIYLFMSGGPSQVDLFDPKPILRRRHGEEIPASVLGQQRVTLMTRDQGHFRAAATPYRFQRHGQCGHPISELLPHTATVADELCLIHSLHTEPINHDPAVTFMQCGREQPGLPCMGSWLSYGLGAENRDLPAFVVMISGPLDQPIASHYYHSGFLPSQHQGVEFQSSGDPVHYLADPAGQSLEARRSLVQRINALNRLRHTQVADPEIEARINSFELAFRMQASVPDLVDITRESRRVVASYGPDVETPGSFARNCLLARRLVERGVRFVQLFHRGWDQHHHVVDDLRRQTLATDQPCAALLRDLKSRGLLDDTLVVWGGEFGRTSFGQGDLSGPFGRDHHPRCFTYWLAGAGVRAGLRHGATDEYGYNIAADPVHVNDLHATLLHLLGIDHQRLTYRWAGRDFRLTDVGGKVVSAMVT